MDDNRNQDLIPQLQSLIEPVIRAEGMELVEMEYRREAPGWVLRLYVDREGGVTVDDCARISQVVGDLLDVADLMPNPYHLEVSSPGLNRPLRKPDHFREQIGRIVEVRTVSPLQKRRNFKGVLLDIKPEGVTMDCNGQTFEIPLALIDRARLCYFDSLEK
ncbi:MAG: ribosome maturation factor RimP [Syntrophobacteraceae bacterium]|nr:ribosome maturation factor RimP [Desulfobacteraceae bacterium]